MQVPPGKLSQKAAYHQESETFPLHRVLLKILSLSLQKPLIQTHCFGLSIPPGPTLAGLCHSGMVLRVYDSLSRQVCKGLMPKCTKGTPRLVPNTN